MFFPFSTGVVLTLPGDNLLFIPPWTTHKLPIAATLTWQLVSSIFQSIPSYTDGSRVTIQRVWAEAQTLSQGRQTVGSSRGVSNAEIE